MGSKSGGKIIGYRYHLGMHLGLCLAAESLLKILINDRLAWQGDESGGSIYVYKPELFGGDDREGGVYGTIEIDNGAPDQEASGYLNAVINGPVPGFRGVFALIFRRFYVGNNPYLKPFSFKLRRTTVDTFYEPLWYQEKADVNGDMNPIHIIYEAKTSEDWGEGYPASVIDDINFRQAADTLYAEGFGMSFQWMRQEPIENLIQLVMNHINGVLYLSPLTGKYEIKLIRNDYSPEELPLFSEANIVAVESFERRAWGETINEVSLVYRDKDDNKDKTITVQDIANVHIQGAVVNQTINMPGISNADIAEKVAFRELLALSSPLAKVVFTVDRSAWNIQRYSVFRFSFAKYGIASQVFRAMAIDAGTLTDGRMKITAVEDVFGMPTAVYAVPQSSGWIEPSIGPVDLTRQRIYEAGYWDIHTRVCQADINAFNPGFAFLISIGSRESGVNFGYRLMTKMGANAYQDRGVFQICPSAIIGSALQQEVSSSFVISSGRDVRLVKLNTYALINGEIVEVVSINDNSNVVTVNRGVLDTVPVAHDAGAVIYFAEFWQGRDETEYIEGDSVNAKLLEVTGRGVLPVDDATELSLSMVNRYSRPYPPGNFKVNGLRYPVSAQGDLTLTWSHRDKTLQTVYLVDQQQGNIGPEPGVTYTVRIYDHATNTVKRTESGVTATTWAYTQAARIADFSGAGPHEVRIELEADDGLYASYQHHSNVLDVSDV